MVPRALDSARWSYSIYSRDTARTCAAGATRTSNLLLSYLSSTSSHGKAGMLLCFGILATLLLAIVSAIDHTIAKGPVPIAVAQDPKGLHRAAGTSSFSRCETSSQTYPVGMDLMGSVEIATASSAEKSARFKRRIVFPRHRDRGDMELRRRTTMAVGAHSARRLEERISEITGRASVRPNPIYHSCSRSSRLEPGRLINARAVDYPAGLGSIPSASTTAS